MSLQALTRRTLVLNRRLQAVNTVSAQEALSKVFSGHALIVTRDLQVHDFDSWVLSWSDAALLARIDERLLIHSERFAVPVPEVIIVSGYDGGRAREVRLSRRNLFLRDGGTCQYCGRRLPAKELNIDHVMPRSRGGRNTWENLVLSCLLCNTYKADRTPEEAGMPLRRPPVKPQWSEIHAAEPLQSWRSYLDAAYWNSQLDSD
ncbi:MAG: hypothetical protein RL095_3992 [Verrucomicrobiota bacterium]|jgi:5-methylcytosine-specific restriction endonuclease McrA